MSRRREPVAHDMLDSYPRRRAHNVARQARGDKPTTAGNLEIMAARDPMSHAAIYRLGVATATGQAVKSIQDAVRNVGAQRAYRSE